MKKLLILFVALFSIVGTMPGNAASQRTAPTREQHTKLLGALAYNIGPGAVNKSSVYKMLKSGNRNIFKAYTSHCHYKGKWHKGLYNRRLTELAALFLP